MRIKTLEALIPTTKENYKNAIKQYKSSPNYGVRIELSENEYLTYHKPTEEMTHYKNGKLKSKSTCTLTELEQLIHQ